MAEAPFTIRFSDETLARIKADSARLQKPQSDIIRAAVEFYFTYDRQKQNMETVLQEFEAVRYEIKKTQFILARVVDPERTVITEQLCEQAGLDAEAWLKSKS
jgi:predicted DNA-binding protein